MSPVPLNLSRSFFLAALAVGFLATAHAQRLPRRATGVQFTEPQNPVTATNSASSAPVKNNLGSLDKAVRKPFELFGSEDSFSGVLAPPTLRPPPPRLRSRRARELLDRKKNWVFDTPEEIYGIETPEEILNVREYGPDGELKAPKTAMERYLERWEKRRTEASTNRVSKSDGNLPSWAKPGDKEEKSLLTVEDKTIGVSVFSKPDAANTTIVDPSGFMSDSSIKSIISSPFGDNVSSGKPFAADTAREARMQAFKQLFETRPAVSAAFNPNIGITSPQPTPANPFSTGNYGIGAPYPQPASRPSTFPAAPPPTSYTPAYSPLPAPTRTLTPAATPFELPKRKF